jgi:hypothetical protein
MTDTTATTTRADRLATLLTDLFTPAHLVIGLLLAIGTTSHPSPQRGLAWGALAALLVGVLPYAWVLHASAEAGSHHTTSPTEPNARSPSASQQPLSSPGSPHSRSWAHPDSSLP